MSTALRTDLPPEPSSAGAARRFVVTACHRLGHDAQSELAELLVSELVTNAVLHARTTITLEVRASKGAVRIGVADESPRSARKRGYSEEATTGRGLTLVETLASAWGMSPTQQGKEVWFELADEVA